MKPWDSAQVFISHGYGILPWSTSQAYVYVDILIAESVPENRIITIARMSIDIAVDIIS